MRITTTRVTHFVALVYDLLFTPPPPVPLPPVDSSPPRSP